MNFIVSIQAVLAILIIICIIFQTRSSGLSSSMGGMGVTYVQRRGAERALYQGTIIFGIAFFVLTLVDWFIF